MQVIRHEWFGVVAADVFRIQPLGDIHLGNAACDEQLFRSVVQNIADDKRCWWIGMGDYADFIKVSDPRFDPSILADWVEIDDLVDLAGAQKERFLQIVQPIADRCLGLIEGNHERAIRRHYERDIYREIVAGVKGLGGLEGESKLALGYNGWLQLMFYRSKDNKRVASTGVAMNVHHGFAGGKLAGGKALNMERWLWTHNADIVLFGHSHNIGVQMAAVEEIDRAGNVKTTARRGAFTGTFLRTNIIGASTYSERGGMFPLPLGGVKIELWPGLKRRVIKIVCEH